MESNQGILAPTSLNRSTGRPLCPRRAKILYVDDEELNLNLFRGSFEDEFQIFTAVSGVEGLEIIRNESDLACVVTDQRMPGMTGVEFLAYVHARAPQIIPMILSAYGDADTIMDAVNRGHVYRFLLKPWYPSDLRQTLRNGVEKYFLSHERDQLLYILEEKNEALTLQTAELAEANTALRTLLRQGTVMREELEGNILASVQDQLLPLIRKLDATNLDARQQDLADALAKGLADLTAPFAFRLAGHANRFSPVEKQVAGLIRAGNSSKEISQLLGISDRTVESHRYRIRAKLGATGTRTYLQDLLSNFDS